MIRILVNKEFNLFLDPETAITLNFNNPLFTYENTEGDYSYPFTIPAISENLSFLTHLHKLESTITDIPVYNIEMYINEVGPFLGTMEIDGDLTENSYEATIFLGKGQFMYETKNKSIKTIDLGGDRSLDLDSLTDIIQQQYPDTDFNMFPVYNENYFQDVFSSDGGSDGKPVYNATMKKFMNYYKLHPTFYSDPFEFDHNPMVLFPYLCKVLDAIFESNGYKVSSNIFKDGGELQSLVIYNTFGNNEVIIPGINYDYKLKIDNWSSVGKIITFNIGGYTITLTGVYYRPDDTYLITTFPTQDRTGSIVYPPDYVKYLKDAFNNNILLNQFYVFDVYSVAGVITGIQITPKVQELSHELTITTDEANFTFIDNSVTQADNKITYSRLYNLINSLPEVSIQEFLQGLKNIFNVEYVYSNTSKTVQIIKADDLINNADQEDWSNNIEQEYILNLQKQQGVTLRQVPDGEDQSFIIADFSGAIMGDPVAEFDDLEALPVILNEVRYVIGEMAYYKRMLRDYYSTPVWEYYQCYYTDYVNGLGQASIETIFSSLVSSGKLTENTPYDDTIKVPTASQVGKSNIFMEIMANNTFTPRLLFYRGIGLSLNVLQPETGPYQYPYASSDDWSSQLVQGYYNYSLFWDGENGLINKFWKNTLYFLSKRKLVTFQKLFSASELTTLNLYNKKRIFNNTVFIKSIQVTIQGDKIQPAKCEAWTI